MNTYAEVYGIVAPFLTRKEGTYKHWVSSVDSMVEKLAEKVNEAYMQGFKEGKAHQKSVEKN